MSATSRFFTGESSICRVIIFFVLEALAGLSRQQLCKRYASITADSHSLQNQALATAMQTTRIREDAGALGFPGTVQKMDLLRCKTFLSPCRHDYVGSEDMPGTMHSIRKKYVPSSPNDPSLCP
ncbi:MAG: hypothetical protein PHF80_01095, partial [Methanothrix sp.]|nr:hypothetical protein [Methanothrix sp.]